MPGSEARLVSAPCGTPRTRRSEGCALRLAAVPVLERRTLRICLGGFVGVFPRNGVSVPRVKSNRSHGRACFRQPPPPKVCWFWFAMVC